MKSNDATREVEKRAATALGSLLGQVSSIKTRDIRLVSAGPRRGHILADIDVLGRSHKLVCHVADGQPDNVRKALQRLRTRVTAGARDNTTQVLIAPCLSPKTRALCEANRVGFLDLEGNAHLIVDEVFIGRRSCRSEIPAQQPERASA